jgi:hypothetical protein
MSADSETARDDLAFMRALVGGSDDWLITFGEAYFAAGVVYGAQILMNAGQVFGWLPGQGLWALATGLGPTVVYIAILVWILRRHRALRPSATGRSLSAVFGSIGLANLALVAVVGSVALREHSITTWLIYPCAVLVLQGAAWLVSYVVRRRGWLGLVAAGWIVAGVAMAQCVQSIGYYLLIAGLSFALCMALPGWVMIRLARRAG